MRCAKSLVLKEYMFMAIYTVELILHLMAYGFRKCFTDGWFVFDAILAPWAADSGQLKLGRCIGSKLNHSYFKNPKVYASYSVRT